MHNITEIHPLTDPVSEKAMDTRARRAARRAGLVARRSRWRRDTVDNYGGFMLIDPQYNYPVAGWRFDLEPEAVIDYCRDVEA
jgi:hypothetical protein